LYCKVKRRGCKENPFYIGRADGFVILSLIFRSSGCT
jgi:hypothetical protein